MNNLAKQLTEKNKRDLEALNATFKTDVANAINGDKISQLERQIANIEKLIAFTKERIRTKDNGYDPHFHTPSKLREFTENISRNRALIRKKLRHSEQVINYSDQIQQKISNNIRQHTAKVAEILGNCNK